MIARPLYRAAVNWIAENDEPTESDAEIVATLISVCLIADLFTRQPSEVAADVVKRRAVIAKAEGRS